MACRSINGGCFFRSLSSSASYSSSASPSPSSFGYSLHHVRLLRFRRQSKVPTVFCFSKFPSEQHIHGYSCLTRTRSIHNFIDAVIGEFEALRRAKGIRAGAKLGVTSKEVRAEDKTVQLKKGLLLEYRKDTERVLLAVAQRPDGKKNWMVYDQNGVTSSIKPQQVTYIVPGAENFDHTQISTFIKKAQDILDHSLLEFAWIEILEKNKTVIPEELAEIIFGSDEPLESYCAHHLLSKDEIYFSVTETKGSCSVYSPRSTEKVEELIRLQHAKEAAEKEFQAFIQELRAAKAQPPHGKPGKSSWIQEKTRLYIESLEIFAIDVWQSDEQRKTAGEVLKAMGLARTASSAVNLLIDIGYYPAHVNLDMVKCNIRKDHSKEITASAESLLAESLDLDEVDRKDLTHLKVYAIDVDQADELDDALSATRLHDGRIKVWIHVADPTRLVYPGSILDLEARRRGTSVFLPTRTYPMFPEKLALEGMSLKQGEICKTITVSVVLRSDGSIAEYSVDNSIIRPTYMLTYDSALELLQLNLEEEAELRMLSEAAKLRLQWRREQGAIDMPNIEARIKVVNPDDPDPQINLYVEDQASPAMRLVTEMMILCGEAIATFGSHNNLCLPYRGLGGSFSDASAFSHLPEGRQRNSALMKAMGPALLDFRQARRHAVMGIPGYVQFTSPIRRYIDLLAHYQVKAFLRGDTPPFTPGTMEGVASVVNMQFKVVRQISNSSLRYWILEYLRRQPKKKRFRAQVLRFIKDRLASLLLVEVGFQGAALVSVGVHIGDEVEVIVDAAHPRNDILILKEVIS